MSSVYGLSLKVTLFGQSHGPAVGVVLDGFPAGMAIDEEALRFQLSRRAPGQSALSTPRVERDEPEFLSGVMAGVTTGQPLCAVIRSASQRSADYGEALDLLRPSHADYTGHVRYYGFEDFRGGGSFSGRLTAPIVLAGALCRQYLSAQGIRIAAHISRLAGLTDDPIAGLPAETDFSGLQRMTLPTLRPGLSEEMEAAILDAKCEGDSVGGCVSVRVDGLPAGLGAPFFDSVESVLAHLLFSVPGVKGVSFGDGFALADMRGSEANDPFALGAEGQIVTRTNHAGGVNGGITNGMPLLLTCVFRPTPSIAKPQQTVSMRTHQEATLAVRGRHDPCIVPRAMPVIEAMTAIGLMDLWKERAACVRE
ncbi:MAG: chorismate synthase [Clostridia bacterium]|nr:chorismate synthase [Clostridia bacterium]